MTPTPAFKEGDVVLSRVGDKFVVTTVTSFEDANLYSGDGSMGVWAENALILVQEAN